MYDKHAEGAQQIVDRAAYTLYQQYARKAKKLGRKGKYEEAIIAKRAANEYETAAFGLDDQSEVELESRNSGSGSDSAFAPNDDSESRNSGSGSDSAFTPNDDSSTTSDDEPINPKKKARLQPKVARVQKKKGDSSSTSDDEPINSKKAARVRKKRDAKEAPKRTKWKKCRAPALTADEESAVHNFVKNNFKGTWVTVMHSHVSSRVAIYVSIWVTVMHSHVSSCVAIYVSIWVTVMHSHVSSRVAIYVSICV